MLHFGVVNRSCADVRVVWPDGTERTFEGVESDNRIVVSREGVRREVPLDGPSPFSGLPFPDLSDLPPVTGVLFASAPALVVGTAVVGYRRYGSKPGP